MRSLCGSCWILLFLTSPVIAQQKAPEGPVDATLEKEVLTIIKRDHLSRVQAVQKALESRKLPVIRHQATYSAEQSTQTLGSGAKQRTVGTYQVTTGGRYEIAGPGAPQPITFRIAITEYAELSAEQLPEILQNLAQYEPKFAYHGIKEVTISNGNDLYALPDRGLSLRLFSFKGDWSKIKLQIDLTIDSLSRTFDGFNIFVDTEYAHIDRDYYDQFVSYLKKKGATLRLAGIKHVGLSNHFGFYRQGMLKLQLNGNVPIESLQKLIDKNVLSAQRNPELPLVYYSPELDPERFDAILTLIERFTTKLGKLQLTEVAFTWSEQTHIVSESHKLWIGTEPVDRVEAFLERL